jgi:hypothetical protein
MENLRGRIDIRPMLLMASMTQADGYSGFPGRPETQPAPA